MLGATFMEDILSLIEIVRKKGQRSIQLVNQNFRKKEISKDNLLYEGIMQHHYHTDEDAARQIFDTDPGNRNFRNAKSKLKQKLLNHLYFLDYEKESYTLYDKHRYEGVHAWHQCLILLRENNHELAAKILPTVVKISRDLELSDILVSSLTILRNEYAQQGKVTLYEETQAELDVAYELRKAFIASEREYYSMVAYFKKSVSAQNRILDEVPAVIQSIRGRAKKFNSTGLLLMAARLELEYNHLTWKFAENVELASSLEKKFLEMPNTEVNVPLDKKQIAVTKIYAYYYLEDYKTGGDYAHKSLQYFKTGSENWFEFIEYYFLLMMKAKNYTKAGELFRKVRTNKHYNDLPSLVAERWHLYRAYLVFFNDHKLIRWGFDIEEFKCHKPEYPKELHGYNVACLIIQVVFLMREGKVDLVKEKMEQLQEYNSTHLDKRHNYRNSIFIRLLNIINDKDFNYPVVKEKGQNYYLKLKKTQIPGDLHFDIEVVPYEILWEEILQILKSNKLYTHYRFYQAKVYS